MSNKTILRYKPHQYQKLIHEDTHRYKIICAGRRFGKSLCICADFVNRCLSPQYNYNNLTQLAWIAPTHQMAQRGIDALKLITQDAPNIVSITKSFPTTATFINGVMIKFLSADNPDMLRGYGFSHVVVDEGDYIPDYMWFDVLQPALSDHQGSMIAISTPRNKGTWFHQLYSRGLQGDDLESKIKSFHFPSALNPYLPAEEVEEARLTLPERIFQREYLAEYTDTGGEVFQGIDKCIKSKPFCTCKARDILGIDLAKHLDFTVIVKMCCACHRIKEIRRFNTISWDEQRKLIKNVYISSVSPVIYLDATGIGDVIYDDLASDGLNVVPIKISNTKKQHLISNLRLRIMEGDISWDEDLENAKILKHELECFAIEQTRTGQITYNAPNGLHDDCVLALSFCVEGLTNYITPKTSDNDEDYVKSEEDMWHTTQEGNYDFGDNATFFGG